MVRQNGLDHNYVDTEECDELPLYTINSKLNKPFLVDLQVKNKVLTFQVITGAVVTIMSSDNFRHHVIQHCN